MKELSLQEVTQENWRAALRLAVRPDQQRFIADYAPIAAIALAKAYIRPGGLIWVPYAFYAGTEIVGFIELAYNSEDGENYWLFHFFIDFHYQDQGYGKKLLQLFLDFIPTQHPRCRSIQATVHPENERAQNLYLSVGFQRTEKVIDGEPVYRFNLSF